MTRAAPAFLLTGVSRGLGQAMFAQLTSRGIKPIGIGRYFTPGQRQNAKAGRCVLLTCDMADSGAVRALGVDTAIPSDADNIVFISNAAVVVPLGSVGSRNAGDVVMSAAVNFTAPMLLAEALSKIARERAIPLSFLNVGSGASRHAIAGWSAYCAAKAGTAMFFSCLAAENPDWSVREVDPGVMDTDMQAKIRCADFPAVADFRALESEGCLQDPENVARDILSFWLAR